MLLKRKRYFLEYATPASPDCGYAVVRLPKSNAHRGVTSFGEMKPEMFYRHSPPSFSSNRARARYISQLGRMVYVRTWER